MARETVVCPICKGNAVDYSRLVVHMAAIHKIEPRCIGPTAHAGYECACGLRFPTAESCGEHLKSVGDLELHFAEHILTRSGR